MLSPILGFLNKVLSCAKSGSRSSASLTDVGPNSFVSESNGTS